MRLDVQNGRDSPPAIPAVSNDLSPETGTSDCGTPIYRVYVVAMVTSRMRVNVTSFESFQPFTRRQLYSAVAPLRIGRISQK